MRELDDFEAESVLYIKAAGLTYSLLELTETMLRKGIADATESIRAWLRSNHLHDYSTQTQGGNAKQVRPARVVAADGSCHHTKVSFYRPETKNGDPRLWFYGLSPRAREGHIMLLFERDELIWAVDITENRLEDLAPRISEIREALRPLKDSPEAVVQELIHELRRIHRKGFIPILRPGSTGVGHLMETLLGIQANSSRHPDYKGVELKSSRSVGERGQTLFAQVANWKISPLTSSGKILDRFGYRKHHEDGSNDFRLYCSVTYGQPNSQGLYFGLDEAGATLDERSLDPECPIVARWNFSHLESRLEEKHKHTLWVRAITRGKGSNEEVRFDVATYRSAPITEQLVPMISSRDIYMDHLIKRIPETGKTTEKGPLFKIQTRAFNKMFADPVVFDLAISST